MQLTDGAEGTGDVEVADAQRTDEDQSSTAALTAGLRAIDATRLPSFAPGHTRRGRVWLLTFKALSVGGLTFAVVAIAPQLVERVERILARPDGDSCLEKLARWCAHGGLDA